jgi:hypothetical protein
MKKDKSTEEQSTPLDPCQTPRPNAGTGIVAEIVNDSIRYYFSSTEKPTITYLWRMIAARVIHHNQTCDADKTLATPSISTIYKRVQRAGTARKEAHNNRPSLIAKKKLWLKLNFRREWHSLEVFLVDAQTKRLIGTQVLISCEFDRVTPTSTVYYHRVSDCVIKMLKNHAATNSNRELRAVVNKIPQTQDDEHLRKSDQAHPVFPQPDPNPSH